MVDFSQHRRFKGGTTMTSERRVMPPHCDAIDGPVVQAARKALELGDVFLVLPFVHAESESEVSNTFDLVMRARTKGEDARSAADQWFFETVVRLHRQGEGATFTGVKPAGLDVGPVIPLAERVIRSGDVSPLTDFLVSSVQDQVHSRFEKMKAARLAADREGSVETEREYVEAMLGLQVWSHKLYQRLIGPAH